MKKHDHLDHYVYALIGYGSAIWLMLQDIIYLLPAVGIAGSVLIIKNNEGRRVVKEIEKEIIELLPKMFEFNASDSNLKIRAFASSVTDKQKQKYDE